MAVDIYVVKHVAQERNVNGVGPGEQVVVSLVVVADGTNAAQYRVRKRYDTDAGYKFVRHIDVKLWPVTPANQAEN